MQRIVEEPVQERPRRAGLVCRAHLPEDLALAGDERVEPRRNSEEVQRRRMIGEPIRQGSDAVTAVRAHRIERTVLRMLTDDVELRAVARR